MQFDYRHFTVVCTVFIFNIFIENNVWVKKLCWKEEWNRYQPCQPSTVLRRQVSSSQWARYKVCGQNSTSWLLCAPSPVSSTWNWSWATSLINLRLFIQLQAPHLPQNLHSPMSLHVSPYVRRTMSLHIPTRSSMFLHNTPYPSMCPHNSSGLTISLKPSVFHIPPCFYTSLYVPPCPWQVATLWEEEGTLHWMFFWDRCRMFFVFFLQGSGRNARNAQCHTKASCFLASEHWVRSLLAQFVELGCVCFLAGSFLTDPGTETRPCSGSVSTNNVHVPQ